MMQTILGLESRAWMATYTLHLRIDAQMQASQGLLDVGEHCVYRSKWSF